jgi:hypothetical protein
MLHFNFGKRITTKEPSFFIRICRKRQEFIKIVNDVQNINTDTSTEKDDIIKRITEYVIEDSNIGMSVYSTATDDPLDPEHATAVIAATIMQKEIKKKSKRGRTCCTILFPAAVINKFFEKTHTPYNNKYFSPADKQHYDIKTDDPSEFASWILGKLKDRLIQYVELSNEDGTYKLQARIAYAMCLAKYGNLVEENPPRSWQNGEDLGASDQISILQYLADPKELLGEKSLGKT